MFYVIRSGHTFAAQSGSIVVLRWYILLQKIKTQIEIFSWLQVVVEYDEESDYTDYFIEIADKVGMFKQTEANCKLFPFMNLKHVLNSVNHIRT